MRRIRNIDFCSQELETLLPSCTRKISGTTIDAFAAVVQEVAEKRQGGQCSFCLFSSWIPAIVSGQYSDGGHAGSIDDHVLAVCNSPDYTEARERPQWALPLCGGNPSHWVLGWVNYSSMQYGITDSMGELESAVWAFPLLKKCLDRLRDHLQMPAMDWSAMTTLVRLPGPCDQQIDSWSCGLFVMIALQSFADEWKTPLLGESAKEHVRAGALQALLKVPERPSRPLPMRICRNDGLSAICTENSEIAPPDAAQKKRRLEEISSDSENTDMTFRMSGSTTARTKRERKPKTTEKERQERLQNDQWTITKDVGPYSVRCAGCMKVVVLDGNKKRRFDVTKWNAHCRACPHITGIDHVRVATMKDGKISYTHKAVPMTPSIRQFFSVTPRASPTSGRPPGNTHESRLITHLESDPIPTPCQHLQGEEYSEYILCTQTRSLGGISRRWRARVTRQIFPYKPFPPLASAVGSSSGDVLDHSCPAGGNLECEETKWTSMEQLKLDEALSGWARWIVNYGRRYVKLTHCEGTTRNASGVCDACGALEKDLGLRRSVLRKNKEAKLSEEDQRHIYVQREKFTPTTIRSAEALMRQNLPQQPGKSRSSALEGRDRKRERGRGRSE
ncbi:hypothetical protein C8Q78DRAFT_1007946 [Trametes maxima]|nr:hypothetical protein C8Q78DRAFT_1007946 [Trametes maxima]